MEIFEEPIELTGIFEGLRGTEEINKHITIEELRNKVEELTLE